MKYVNKTFPTDEVNELEIYYHCFPDVEIHYRPFIMHNPIKNQKLYKFFKEEGERCWNLKGGKCFGLQMRRMSD